MKSLNLKLLILAVALVGFQSISADTIKGIQIVDEDNQAHVYGFNDKGQFRDLGTTADQHYLYDITVGTGGVSFSKQSGWFGTAVVSVGKIINMTGAPIYYVLKDYSQNLSAATSGTIQDGQSVTLPKDSHVPWKNSGALTITMGLKPLTITVNQ